jgi:hypothetical protein
MRPKKAKQWDRPQRIIFAVLNTEEGFIRTNFRNLKTGRGYIWQL